MYNVIYRGYRNHGKIFIYVYMSIDLKVLVLAFI